MYPYLLWKLASATILVIISPFKKTFPPNIMSSVTNSKNEVKKKLLGQQIAILKKNEQKTYTFNGKTRKIAIDYNLNIWGKFWGTKLIKKNSFRSQAIEKNVKAISEKKKKRKEKKKTIKQTMEITYCKLYKIAHGSEKRKTTSRGLCHIQREFTTPRCI